MEGRSSSSPSDSQFVSKVAVPASGEIALLEGMLGGRATGMLKSETQNENVPFAVLTGRWTTSADSMDSFREANRWYRIVERAW
jgi:hypothetical protein